MQLARQNKRVQRAEAKVGKNSFTFRQQLLREMADAGGSYPIPVIDMQDFPGESAKLIKACEEWGCFRIVNFQGVLPESLMLEMKGVMGSLLELPREIKMRNRDVIAGSGYMAPSQINPLYEALGLYDMASTPSVDDFCSNLEATPHQRATILKYAKAVRELMMEIGHKIGEGVGVHDVSLEDWVCQFRINSYKFSPETVSSSGLQLHTDASFLTVLQDDEIGGLEVMKPSGEFVALHPCPGTLVVNLGDIAAMWSNGRFLNVKHRVMCKEAGIRISIASFLLGPREAAVEAPPELVDVEHPRLFVPFTYLDYRNLRIPNKLDTGEALHRLRLH
ncbi:2-oxoglutarate-dependent dioxygenase DAO-like [Sesamum indicum]|uniref:2-oxoglutarate-dependent dioxygenase DAO n=1 Tax=Sesamum indicum TaxID=4182 RepID=A0A6I9TJU5_SESIN|nr:2-oxoglutarate-dependent dioxygenase DAO-like [Sesamum indicum]